MLEFLIYYLFGAICFVIIYEVILYCRNDHSLFYAGVKVFVRLWKKEMAPTVSFLKVVDVTSHEDLV
ncbi:unnamed protein product [Leptidea sinapis]|uniref:Uncharacterized protein n=1 Tax=Leptidea sinapis TaxID=189913 RepID=A0A5E4R5N2_9NEOP|nr:unnamed protein product [Leptidea sinapis]